MDDDRALDDGVVIAKSRQLLLEAQAQVAKAHAHARDMRRLLASSRAILESRPGTAAAGGGLSAASPLTAPPDALCALFDALYEAVRQADAHGDPDLVALAERAFLHAGEKVEAIATTMADRHGPIH